MLYRMRDFEFYGKIEYLTAEQYNRECYKWEYCETVKDKNGIGYWDIMRNISTGVYCYCDYEE